MNFKHFTGGHFTETQEAKLEIIRKMMKFGLTQMNIYLFLFIHYYFDSVSELKKNYMLFCPADLKENAADL